MHLLEAAFRGTRSTHTPSADVVWRECDDLRWRLEDVQAETVAIRHMTLPSGRPWSYVPDAKVLAISPDVDEATEERLRAQVQPPELTTCETCGAPLYTGRSCGMHDA
jgi:hypothetical protein